MKKTILTGSHVSRIARFFTQIGYRIALAATPLLALGSAQVTEAQTTIQVTTTQQGVTDAGNCSLQEAIYAAEFGSNTALNLTDPDRFYMTGCVLQGANGPFTIVLQKTVYSFDTFWDRDAHNPFGLTATPIIFTNIIIQGNGATLQWTGTGNSRLFAVGSASIVDTLDNRTVSGTGVLRLESVYIKGFRIKGGDGSCGGGGGLGAGGAIYVGKVDSGVPSLDVEDSTFDSNFAIGGNGSHSGCPSDSRGAGGGGGGLSGNGGIGEFGGGGGGGSRGNGGGGLGDHGGGGGGTIFDGGDGTDTGGGSGAYLCGGGGGFTNNGHGATCPGGGGGGGGVAGRDLFDFDGGDGADASYGGGGGGGGAGDAVVQGQNPSSGSGGNGGFGGGGGGSGTVRSLLSGSHGGNGGFGGGAGFGIGTEIDLHGEPGNAGRFGGGGNGSCCGGGGGALGGAIFNQGGTVFVRNSTFTGNDVDRGEGGVNDAGTDSASRGGDSGAAIFSLNGSLVIENSTISGNFATGAGGGVVVVADPLGAPASVTASFTLSNTIISQNGSNECIVAGTSDPINGHVGTVDAQGSGNLILNNNGCPGVAVSADPQLAPLALDPHSTIGTPTMALPAGSPAVDAADDSHFLSRDQRGVARPQGPHSDIGAFEFKPLSADLTLTSQTPSAQIVAGESFTYTVQLINSGPDDAANVAFSDLAPAGVTFTSCSSTVGTCAVSGGGASLNLATLPNGETVTITIQATLNATVADGTTLTNAPSVSSSTHDPDTSNNTGSAGSVSITVQNKSDLLVSTASNVDVINFGGTLIYTVTVKNLGPFQASAVTLVDPLPAQAIFLSINSGGASCTAPPLATSGTIMCSFGNMASGASATVSFTVRISIPPVPASISNTAVVSSPNFDPNPANNSATVTTLVFGNKRL